MKSITIKIIVIIILIPLSYRSLKIRFSNPQLTETQLLLKILKLDK